MTPFGQRIRQLRGAKQVSLRAMAAALEVSPAYLSALEHGKRGMPTAGLVHQICAFFDLIWDDADEIARLARMSDPQVTLNCQGLSPAHTELANRLGKIWPQLSEAEIQSFLTLLDQRA
ncbi:MAG: transcriptional regulator [Rhodospirillales bacterium 20-60-12]|nr:MAG: transcriptional regulator [Rhodospirillales bacterium 20-60-12]